MEEIESVSRVWSEDLASQASRLGFARLLDFSAPSAIQARSVAAPLHYVVCKDIGQCQPLAVGVLDFSLQLLADIALLFYARRGVEHGANKDEGDGGELLGQGGEACDGDSPSLFQRPAAPVDEVRGGHCRA